MITQKELNGRMDSIPKKSGISSIATAFYLSGITNVEDSGLTEKEFDATYDLEKTTNPSIGDLVLWRQQFPEFTRTMQAGVVTGINDEPEIAHRNSFNGQFYQSKSPAHATSHLIYRRIEISYHKPPIIPQKSANH